MQDAVEQMRASAIRYGVIALDIDHFKNVNDTHGHSTGDEVIRHMAQIMRECSRPADVLCRNGGEEFLMLLPGAGLKEAGLVAERLRKRVEARPMPGIGGITVSAGVACWRISARSRRRPSPSRRSPLRRQARRPQPGRAARPGLSAAWPHRCAKAQQSDENPSSVET